jgi:FixJ family two-component response regulator
MSLADSNPARLLLADDQSDVLEALRLLLKPEGYAVETASSPAGALATAESAEFDVAFIDLNYARDTTSGAEGLDLLKQLRRLDPTLGVVTMTAWASIELAVEAIRQGARDFVQKPWENQRLLAIVATQVALTQALRRGQRLEAENMALRGGADFRPHDDRFVPRHGARAADHLARRTIRRIDPGHRRERRRQRRHRTGDSRGVAASRAPARHREHRGLERKPL